MVAHALSSRVPASAHLGALVAALRGRLAVANHPRAVRLPNSLATAGARARWCWARRVGIH